ncbi:MAG: VPLPA-CTERM sorting domain-containing protein [Alphaproteobacteria bacterium]|nr:VPLPA-CTERM sorting domain-containing protein [Alphaproteobacteria bacterium]
MGFKRHVMAVLAACVLAGSGAIAPARAATVAVDQNNPSVQAGFCYTYARNLCGQSFQQSGDTLAGAGIYLSSLFLNLGNAVTLSVFSTYGRTPGGLIASGTQTAGGPGWVDVFWDSVAITPGQTYYLVASSLLPNIASYSAGNTYAGGNALYAGNAGGYANYDLTFRTYAAVPDVIVTPPDTPPGTPSPVPLPASLTLMLGALGVLSAVHWRRRRVV